MAAFQVPREMSEMSMLSPTMASIVARLWEVECLGTLEDEE